MAVHKLRDHLARAEQDIGELPSWMQKVARFEGANYDREVEEPLVARSGTVVRQGAQRKGKKVARATKK